MALISDIALLVFLLSFLSGLLITAVSGSVKAVKIYLGTLTLFAIIGLIIALIASGGLLVFLLFQVITLMIIIFFIIIAGAVTGGAIYKLIHYQSAFKRLKENELSEYLPLDVFSGIENITEERASARIKSGYYLGGIYNNMLYIHKSEQSAPAD